MTTSNAMAAMGYGGHDDVDLWAPGWDGVGQTDVIDEGVVTASTPPGPVLPIRRLADVAAEVDGRGPRRWLVRGVFPAGDYGVHGAEPKAGKTWNALDLGVSVATGTPWPVSYTH